MSTRRPLITLLCLLATSLQPAVAEEIRDYYAEPGINPFKETVNDGFNEQIDPFSGTLQLKYTDVHVPGNGGLDLDITRTYTSLQTNAYPRLGRSGMGWTMHFGRIVISEAHRQKLCNQASFGITTIENPSLELPDGGRELLVLNHINGNNDGTLITRSNWKAQCHAGTGMLVTAPNGTRYTMDRFDWFEEEPSWHTTHIEDVHGNWIAIDYDVNAVGVNYITQIRRSEDGIVATFEYEDQDGPGIVLSRINANGQSWTYHYETIPGFMFNNYKQLVSVGRPDGTSWNFQYNPKMSDPDPNDDILEDGIASYSLTRVTYPHGASASYTYQYVLFDPGAPTQKTTAIHTKNLSGTRVTGGTWTYEFAPHSRTLDAGSLRYDVTTVHAPDVMYRYTHMGKDYGTGSQGQMIFFRPSFVGLLMVKETFSRDTNPRLLERRKNSWNSRKVSNEDFWHGAGYRSWWRDDGTYAAVLVGEYINQDSRADDSLYLHAREYFDYDAYGNPGRVIDYTTLADSPHRQVVYQYRNDTAKWILGLAEHETHQQVGPSGTTTLGTVDRDYNANGLLLSVVDFGEETRYTYHGTGDLHTMRDARGNVTRYSDYKRGIARTEERADSVVIHRTVNNDGTLASETNGRGHITRYQYDDLHRLTHIDYPVKSDVAIQYDNGSGVYRRILTRSTYRQTETINDFGSVLRVFREDTFSGQGIARDSEFDAHHRQTFQSYPNASIGTHTEYDALGRVLRIQHPDDAFVDYSYDAVRTTVTNERQHATHYHYMSFGTDLAAREPVSIFEPENVGTIIHRDVWGNVVEVFQGQSQNNNHVSGYAKTYRYDERRLLVESVEREVGTTVFAHDEVGNVISERVNNLPAVTFEYDSLNRRTLVNFADDTPDVSTVYDANGNPERVTKGATRWDYTYDENDNLRSETLTVTHALLGNRVFALTHEYSDLDVLAQTTYPSGLAIAYAPDAFGRATRVGDFASNVTYHPSGPVASYQLANGVTTTVALNERLLTQSIAAPGVVNLAYGYDSTGNVLQILDGIDSSKNVQMSGSSYDGLNRLLNANGKWGSSSFTYDHLGNFRSRQIGPRGLNYALDESLRVRSVSRFNPANPQTVTGLLRYDFDQRGNANRKVEHAWSAGVVNRIDDRRFEYDAASQLIRARVTRTAGSDETVLANKLYVYDGNGQRVLEQKHGSYDIRFSVYAQGGQLLFEDSLAECTRTDYIRLGALSVARSDDRTAAPQQDTDGDLIPDCLETTLGLNPDNAADALADRDADGVSNLDEYRAGTSLDSADTDGDGVSDFHELNRDLTDPSSNDTDGDGLSDSIEAANPALDPRLADKDHDGVSDYWEVQLATNPENPADALDDFDGDGFSNRQESQGGSDPVLAGATPARGTQLWTSNNLGAFHGELAIGPDRSVYATGADFKVRAFHPDGKKRWEFQVPLSTVSDPVVGPDGTIYVVSSINGGVVQGQPRSFVHALNPDGSQRWARGTTDFLGTAAALGDAGRLYVAGFRFDSWSGSVSGVLQALNASTGSIMNTVLPTNGVHITPVVSFTGDVFVADETGRLLSYSATLAHRWTYVMRAAPATVASVDRDGTVYTGDVLGYVYAVSNAGALRWDRQVSPGSPQYSSVTIGTNGALYVGSYDTNLLALSAVDGSISWTADTTGTVYTPAVANDGTVYATTYSGELLAFDPAGTQLWRLRTGMYLDTSPVIDRDGTLYFANRAGQIQAVADNGGGPARSPWPMRLHDSASTGYTCFNERAFSVSADDDGDRIDDCSELRYGLDPANAADGAADMDGDGLLNWEEHERGLSLDAADTDGDGLNDGIEVHTYHTDPKLADTDHDGLSDGLETQLGTNPLDIGDAYADSDGDGFSNRQESWAGTDLVNATSAPTVGQVAREESLSYTQKHVAVGRDGTIYQNSANGLEALHPDFTPKWNWPTPIIGAPVIGPDGTIYVSGARDAVKLESRLYALLPNGAVRWSIAFSSSSSQYGLYAPPVLGPNGVVYVMETGTNSQGDLLHAYDANGVHLPGWGGGGRVFGRKPSIAVLPNGNVVAYDYQNSLSVRRASNGTELWRVDGGSSALTGPVVGPDGTIYLARGDVLAAYNPDNGQTRWLSSGVRGYPLIDAQNRIIAYCASQADLCAIDPATGARLWTDTNDYQYVGAPVIDAEGSILALTQNNVFIALNGDGTLRWETPVTVNSGANYPVVLNDGTIYVGASGKRLLLLGSGRGEANSPWSSQHRNHKNSRSAIDLPDVEPSQAPLLNITAPMAASIRVDAGQDITATAVASDFQDGVLSDAIQWTSSLSGLVGTGPTLPLGGLAIGMHTLTASVTDSSSFTASASRSIEVGVFPPELTIYQPYDGTTYDHGSAVTFDAISTDVKDGDISASVVWTSSLNGVLGNGRGLTRNDLSVGTHLITATSTDSSGTVTTASVTIDVEALPPTVEIYSPYEMEEFEFGEPLYFYAYAYDQVDGDLEENLRWVSDLEGEIGIGGSITVSNLRLGTHVITASVADSTGAVGSQSRLIVIRHVPPSLSVSSPWYFEDLQYGDFLEFSASADDIRDGDLTDSIQWTSSLDGLLGTGSGFGHSELSVGFHTITASVTDSNDQTTTQTRTVRVSSPDNTAPFVSITAPIAGAQVYLNDVVTLTATGYDTQDGNISGSIQWSSSLEGPLGTGATLSVATLRVGTHSLRAFVADSTTGKGAATVQITVLPIPDDYPPTIRFTSIGVGSRLTADAAFPLSAVATDREDGDISSSLTWSSSLDGPLGSGATTFVAGLSVGTHDITARAVDSYGNVVTTTRTMEVFPDGESLLLSDGFSVQTGPDVLAGWQKFDDGTSFPSNWFVVSGALGEYGNAQAGSSAAAVIDKPGTYMRQTTGTYWLDYKLEARLRSTDNDGIGLMFRFVDNNNYYRFSMDSERQFRRLVKKVNGVYTLLWSDAAPYVVGQNYEVAITAEGSSITLEIDGVELWSGMDGSHRRGTIALYAWSETQAFFDNVKVTNLRTTESNDPPQLSITGPAEGSSHTVGLPVLLSGTALDFEDGTLSQDIAWSSNVDGALGTGAMLDVSTLQLGPHEITASVTDSDGALSTATLNITIAPPFNEPPILSVTAPSEGASFNVGTAVSFAATASDAEDGDIGNGISWVSSRDGLLGTGASLGVSSLSAGVHVITASITDSGGKSAMATRNITVVVPGNTQPTLTLAAPLNGAAFPSGQSVALNATAADTEDGNLTASIAWTSSIDGALGIGGTVNVATLTGGVHTISATVNDSMGGTRTASASITVVPTAGVLLFDDFSDNNYTGWSVTNQGTISAPSAWSASTGVLRQTSDIHSSPTTASTVPKTGTFNRWTAGSSWTNYSVTTELRSSDNDTLGVMFRYTSTSNYYRFSMDAERSQRRLTKVRNGTWTTLWSDSTAYQQNRTYVLEIIANGNNLTVKLDGVQLWSGSNSQALTTGTVAMYTWQNNGAQFDNMLVRNLSVPLASAAPFKGPVKPAAGGDPWAFATGNLMAMLVGQRGEPRPGPEPEPEPTRLAMLLPRFDLHRAAGAGSLQ